MYRLHTTSVFDVLHMQGKLKRYPFQWNWSYVQIRSESSEIIKRVPISRIVFGAASLFWPDGPCIQLECIRDTS
jgi:hypothetical protein